MQKQKQLKTAQDYLDAADREFENSDALAGTERLWEAITHTLMAIIGAKGWAYDAGDLFPVVKRLAEQDAQVSYILEGIYLALKGHPGLVRAEYFRFEYGDTHRARQMTREFIDAVLQLASESGSHVSLCEGEMQTPKQLKTAQDYLDAADREFENADALAATEHLWAAITCTLKAVADEKGWEYDTNHLFPIVEKLAGIDGRGDDVLQSTYLAAKSFPNKPRYGYFVWEDGDSHWMRRVTHEFIATVQELAGRSQ